MAKEIIQSVDKCFQVMEAMAGGLNGIRELQNKTGYSLSAVRRIVNTLTELGYAYQDETTSRYGLTWRLVTLAEKVRMSSDLIPMVHPILLDLSDKAGATAHFAKRSGTNIRYLDKASPSSGIIVVSSYIGLELPLYCTAMGKSMLADASEEEIRKAWTEMEILPLTSHTITDFDTLKTQLKDFSKKGYALDQEEREEGICCIAVSLAGGEYALSISAPSPMMTPESIPRFRELLFRARDRIRHLTGK